MPRPIGISITAPIATINTVRLLTLPRFLARGRAGVVSSGTRQSPLVNPAAGPTDGGGSSQR